MSQTTDDTQTPDFTPDFLFPLRGKHTRTGAVTAQLAALRGLSRAAVLRRAEETGKDRRLERETLVAVVRGFLRLGRSDDADAVLLLLLKRVSGAIAAKTAAGAGLTPEDKMDAQRDMLAVICEKACDLRPGAEFWECNFAACVNRRLITLWHSLTDHALPIVSNTAEGSGGGTIDRLEQYADPAETFRTMEMQSLAALVSSGHPKRSRALFLKMNGYSNEEIAARLGVTTRTLRNWTAEACAAWVRSQAEDGE